VFHILRDRFAFCVLRLRLRGGGVGVTWHCIALGYVFVGVAWRCLALRCDALRLRLRLRFMFHICV
jgi:hypothetical protein